MRVFTFLGVVLNFTICIFIYCANYSGPPGHVYVDIYIYGNALTCRPPPISIDIIFLFTCIPGIVGLLAHIRSRFGAWGGFVPTFDFGCGPGVPQWTPVTTNKRTMISFESMASVFGTPLGRHQRHQRQLPGSPGPDFFQIPLITRQNSSPPRSPCFFAPDGGPSQGLPLRLSHELGHVSINMVEEHFWSCFFVPAVPCWGAPVTSTAPG